MLALAFAAMVSCGPMEWDNTPYQPDPILPEYQKPKTVLFTANVATKTILNETDNSVAWESGDRVKFIWKDGFKISSAMESGSVTTFEVDIPAVVEKLYAVYPAEMECTLVDDELIVDFPKTLDGGSYSTSDLSIARAVATEGEWGTVLNFKKAASIVKVGVVEEFVTSLTVQAPGNEAIAGILPVSMDAEDNIKYGTPTEGASEINMSLSGPGIYWLPVFPDVALSEGLNVTIFNDGSQVGETLVSDNSLLGRGDIVEFKQPEIFNGKYYVTPHGSGSMSGYSVLNSMDINTFKSFVADADKIADFNGKTFRFSANQFSFGDDYLSFDYPDYPEEVVITLEGSVSGSKVTEFVGRTNTEDVKAGVLWPKSNTHLKVKDVRFIKTNGNSNSAAIRINTSSAKLSLEGCEFLENRTAGHGAAIAAFKGLITIDNCTFDSNEAGCGAGLFVEGPVTVNVSNSVFKENLADCRDDSYSAGAVFYAAGDAVLNFTGTKFIENLSIVGGEKAGGVVRMETSTGAAYFDRCLFDGNNTSRETSKNTASAAIFTARVAANYYFNACEFTDNTSGTANSTDCYGGKYGVLMAMYAGGTIALNNCYVHDNYGGRNIDEIWWFYIDNSDAKFILSNTSVIGDCTRYGNSSPRHKNGVIRLKRQSDYHIINSIICSNYTDGKSVGSEVAVEINSLYNKTSPELDADIQWGDDTGSGHDYYATTASFGGLDGYLWNGTLTGQNSDKLAPAETVKAAIQSADENYYNWLDEIGALDKDIEGNLRGATLWPGCYQAY